MRKLQIGFMRELKNNEFAILVKSIAQSLSHLETTEQPLQQLLERIKFHAAEMYYLKDQTPSHPITEEIGELTKKRTRYLISLRLQIEGKMLSHKEHEQASAKHLHRWLQNNKKYLYAPSITPQTGQIMSLMAEMERHAIIKQSLINLGLDDLLDTIVEVTEQIVLYDSKRTDDKPKKSKRGKALRSAAYKDMQLLVNILDAMMGVYPEKSVENIYYNVSQKVAKQLKKSHTILKSRTTKRRNKQNLEKAVAKLVRSTSGKEKSVIPNNSLSQLLSEAYLKKEEKALICTMAEAEGEVKRWMFVRDNKRKVPIGKNWRWKLPQIWLN